MKITGLDIETTGLEQPEGHRIIEVCLRTYDLHSRKLLDTFEQRIYPQRAIDAKAQAVHGISINDLTGCPVWEDVAPAVAQHMRQSELLIAHNMAFDGPFIALELMRVGVEVPETPSFCTMESARWATPWGKKPSLKELCFALKVDYDPAKAHAAAYDVDRMMECLFSGLERGFFAIDDDEAEEAA